MAEENEAYTVDMDLLEKLLKTFKKKMPVCRVGILGASGRGDGPTNAEVGAAHEFGTARLPKRSFLIMPLRDNLVGELEKSQAFSEDVMKEVIKKGTIKPWMEKITKVAEGIVIGAFSTAGYGKWRQWKNGYENSTGTLLIDTQQLRNSISSDVKDDS